MTGVLARGAFLLSIDTELAWGSVHNGQLRRRQAQFRLTRTCVTRLVGLLEKFQIHATWAVVGHLFLEQCQPVNGVKHPEIIRPTYGWFPGDWFDPDPCTQLEKAPYWYGRDIVQQILNCKIKQEIGCHTFSHIRVGEPGCSRECFASELQACHLAAKKFGVTLESFVFPRNTVGHLDVLSEYGFVSYRGEVVSQSSRLPGVVRRLLRHLAEAPTALPEEHKGLWNLPASMFYPPPLGRTWPIAVAMMVHKAKRTLHRAALERRTFHLWFHPFNLACHPDRLLGGLENIFAEVCRLRDAGLLDNPTMGELAHTLQLSNVKEVKERYVEKS